MQRYWLKLCSYDICLSFDKLIKLTSCIYTNEMLSHSAQNHRSVHFDIKVLYHNKILLCGLYIFQRQGKIDIICNVYIYTPHTYAHLLHKICSRFEWMKCLGIYTNYWTFTTLFYVKTVYVSKLCYQTYFCYFLKNFKVLALNITK